MSQPPGVQPPQGPYQPQGQNQGPYQSYGPGSPPSGGAPPQKKHRARNGCLGCGGLIGLIIIIVIIVMAINNGTKSSAPATSGGDSTSDSSSSSSSSDSASSSTSASSSSSSRASSSSSTSTTAADSYKSKIDDQYGSFAPVTRSGTTSAVITIPGGAKAGLITSRYRGSSNFIIEGLDDGNQPTGDFGLPNAIGNYSGTSMFGADDLGNKAVRLKVEAVGKWTITIKPVSSAPVYNGGTIKGTSDSVYLYTGPARTMNVKYVGTSNFIVSQVGSGFGGADVNEIDSYSGQTPFVEGTEPVTIKADGAWSITAG